MAIYVDFVGLNTLIAEPVDTQTNTIGDFTNSAQSKVRNTSIKSISQSDYLVALNTHRNGPYGYPLFRQIRNSDNAVVRKQKLDNTFSHFEYPGDQLVYFRGKARITVPRKRKDVSYYLEVPVVSKHKPLKLEGAVTSISINGNDQREEVEVYTTLGNQTQYFSNKEINRFFDLKEVLDEDYENFIDLYLDGGLDGDESPIDEFKLVKYSQVVYPREKYTYTNNTRNRPNFVSGYWRDTRSDRNELDLDNGFGFQVFSQSMWVLDAEQDFEDLTFVISPGTFTLASPWNWISGATSASAFGFNFPDSAANTTDTAVYFSTTTDLKNLQDFSIVNNPYRRTTLWDGYVNEAQVTQLTDEGSNKWSIKCDAQGIADGAAHHGVTYRLDSFFESQNFNVTKTHDWKLVKSWLNTHNLTTTEILPVVRLDDDAKKQTWIQNTTQSCLSWWMKASDPKEAQMPNGVFFEESLGDMALDTTSSLRRVSLNQSDNGTLCVDLATTYARSTDSSPQDPAHLPGGEYTGPIDPGISHQTSQHSTFGFVRFKFKEVFGDNNRFSTGDDKEAHGKWNHFFLEMDLANTGSDPATSGSTFRTNLAAVDGASGSPFPVRLYINGEDAGDPEVYDPHYFLTGSTNYHTTETQMGDAGSEEANVSLKKKLNNDAYVEGAFTPITPFGSTGFSFSYWFKGATFTDDSEREIFSLKDSDGDKYIKHLLKGRSNFTGGKVTIVTEYTSSTGTWASTTDATLDPTNWYNIAMTVLTASAGNMDHEYYINATTSATTWENSTTMTQTNWSSLSSSSELVIAAGRVQPWHIDQLAFWNGGLNETQLSSSYNSGSSLNFDVDDYPKTSNSKQLLFSETTNAILRNSFKSFEMNCARDNMGTSRSQYQPLHAHPSNTDGARTQPAFWYNKDHIVIPGNGGIMTDNTNTGVDFDAHVLSQGASGSFDMSLWFKCTEGNLAHRSLRFSGSHSDEYGASVACWASSSFPYIGENDGYERPVSFNFYMKIPDHDAMSAYNYVYPVFTFTPRAPTQANAFDQDSTRTEILKENDFSVYVLSSSTVGIQLACRTGHRGAGSNETTTTAASRNMFSHISCDHAFPEDKWTNVYLHWNGKYGSRARLFYHFQGEHIVPGSLDSGSVHLTMFSLQHSSSQETGFYDGLPGNDTSPSTSNFLYLAGHNTTEDSRIQTKISLCEFSVVGGQSGGPATRLPFNNFGYAMLNSYTSNQRKFASNLNYTARGEGNSFGGTSDNVYVPTASFEDMSSNAESVQSFQLDYDSSAAGDYGGQNITKLAPDEGLIIKATSHHALEVNSFGSSRSSFVLHWVMYVDGDWENEVEGNGSSPIASIDIGGNAYVTLFVNRVGKIVMTCSDENGNKVAVELCEDNNSAPSNYDHRFLFDGKFVKCVWSWNGDVDGSGNPIQSYLKVMRSDGTTAFFEAHTSKSNYAHEPSSPFPANFGTSDLAGGATEVRIGPNARIVEITNYNSGNSDAPWEYPSWWLLADVGVWDGGHPFHMLDLCNTEIGRNYPPYDHYYPNNTTSASVSDHMWFWSDCSPGVGRDTAKSIYNVLVHDPELIHYYHLGSEEEFWDTPYDPEAGRFFVGQCDGFDGHDLNNSGSYTDGKLKWGVAGLTNINGPGRMIVMDDVPNEFRTHDRHDTEHPIFQLVPGTSTDQPAVGFREDPSARGTPAAYSGITLTLSGGYPGYTLVSAIDQSTTNQLLKSADNFIKPGQWYNLYAVYSGFNRTSGTPAVSIYLNGTLVDMTTNQINAGSGHWDFHESSGGRKEKMVLGTYWDGYNTLPTVGTGSSMFTGMIQDFTLWDNNSDATDTGRITKMVNQTAWGAYSGSHYVDTSDPNLIMHFKIGGSTTDNAPASGLSTDLITSYTGSAFTESDWNVDFDSGDDVAKIWASLESPRLLTTDVPKHLFTSTPATVSTTEQFAISFWADFTDTSSSTLPIQILNFTGDDGLRNVGGWDAENHYPWVQGYPDNYVVDTSSDASNNASKSRSFSLNLSHDSTGDAGIRASCFFDMDYKNTDLLASGVGDSVVFTGDFVVRRQHTHAFQIVSDTNGRNHWTLVFTNSTSGTYMHVYRNGSLEATDEFSTNLKELGVSFPTFNNILIGDEEEDAPSGFLLDELAVIKIDNDEEDWTSASARLNFVTRIYSSGNNYDFSLEGDSHLLAWWRMGDNNEDSIIIDTDLQRSNGITDQTKQNYKTKPVYDDKFQIKTVSVAGSDLVTHIDFNENKTPGDDVLATDIFSDRIGSHTFTASHVNTFEWDFTFDSYYIQTEAWLANKIGPDYVGFSATPHKYSNGTFDGSWTINQDGSKPQAIADIAIYRGVQSSSDKNKAKTTLAFTSAGQVGDQLRFIQGEDATTIWVVNFEAASSQNQFSSAPVDGITVKTARINSAGNLQTQMDDLDDLLDNTTSGQFSNTTTYGVTNTDTSVIIEADTAVTKTKNIHAVATVWANGDEPTIEVIKGYGDFVKSLIGYPKHHYVQMNDTAYHRNLPAGTPGLSSSAAPFVYYYENSNTSFFDGARSFVNNGSGGSDFDLHLTGNAPSDFILNETHSLDSGSTTTYTLANKPSLDLNWISINRNSWWDSGSTTGFVSPSGGDPLIGGSTGARSKFGPGILQNNYNQFTTNLVTGAAQQVDNHLTAACSYFRRHSLTASTSTVAPYSGFLAKLTASHDISNNKTALITDLSASHLYLGSAKWEAGKFAGYYDNDTFVSRPKTPFFDRYSDFVSDARPLMKDYGIVPEFKISDHVSKYLTIGPSEENQDLFSITGGLATADTSAKADFFEVYSSTDFLKHFEIIQEDHSDFVDPYSIKLRCSVVKKFLPYDGFYPAQRSVQIAQQFYNSNAQNLNVTGNFSAEGNNFGAQYLLNPLFSPGVLFNSIKAGVACDYPLITDTGSIGKLTGSQDGGAMITQPFDTRIPFEALLEPEKYLANIRLASNEPDPNGDTGVQVVWNGQSSKLYNLMVSNFLSEVSEFFLLENNFTTLTSLSQGDPNFGNAQAGKTYHMRLRMFRNISGSKEPAININSKSFGVPQDYGSMSEAFTMYSRPSAFGPPHYLSASFTPTTWASYKNAAISDMSYKTGSSISNVVGMDPAAGYNYTFTPPYYHGEAWADILFKATDTKKYTLSEIINGSSVEFSRFYESGSSNIGLPGVTDQTVAVNDQAMQLASSVNLFSMGVLEGDIIQEGSSLIPNITINTDLDDLKRWVIQSKFETPILNFNHYTYGTGSDGGYGITLPGTGPAQTPIGMWHQYGRIPQKDTEGIFLQASPIPLEWFSNKQLVSKQDLTKYSPLTDLCGFSTSPKRMGELAGMKEISEAVVAIPFYEAEGKRKFFNLSRSSINNSLGKETKHLVGETIINMVEKMQKFVMPPPFDFLYNKLIDPISMYIFEFTHKFDKQDLSDMWQNLPPEASITMEAEEVSISHELLSYELLGSGAKYRKGAESEKKLMRNDRSTSIRPDIQWMVFKVKQQATTNYFEKIYARNESQQALADKIKGFTSKESKGQKEYSYNWPYDFCSLVEGIKMTAEVQFLEVDEEQTSTLEKPVFLLKKKIPIALKTAVSTIKPIITSGIAGPPPPIAPLNPIVSPPTPSRRGIINRLRRVPIINNSKNKGKK
jgi:hypothetical protein